MEGREIDRETSRSGSRKRERSKSPAAAFKKPHRTRDSRSTKKQNHRPVTAIGNQTKITNYKTVVTDTEEEGDDGESRSNMATKEGETAKPLTEFEKLILEKLKGLDTKMDSMNKKLDERMDKLESRMFTIEKVQDGQRKEIDEIQKQHSESMDKVVCSENIAKTSYEKAYSNEQYQRNFNVRIFNLPESEDESIQDCEEKVLKLFNEKMKVKVPIEAIDVLHRLGRKKSKPKNTKNNSNENQEQINQNDKDQEGSKNNHETSQNTVNQNNPSSSSSTSDINKDQGVTSKDQEIDTEPERPVIVSFLSRRIRREVLTNRSYLKKNLRLGERAVGIVEDLTKQNYTLLKKVKNSEKYEAAWSKDGNIFGRQALNGLVVQIKTMEDIDSPPITHSDIPPSQHYRGYTRGRQHARGQGRGRTRGRGQPRWKRGSGRTPNSSGGEGIEHFNKYGPLREDETADAEMSSDDERFGMFD